MANVRIGIPSNLPQNGTYDIDLLDFGQAGTFPVGGITIGFGSEPRKTTGIQKVAQIFLKCLLTPVGSNLMNPTYGTGFSKAFIGSTTAFTSNTQATMYVQQFITSATQQVIKLTNGNDPASTLRSITIQSVTVAQDATNITLHLVTQAGEYASIAVPFPQLNMTLAQ